MKTTVRALRALTLALVVTACDSGPTFPEEVEFDASTGVVLANMTKLPSGVYIQTKVAGTGPALTATDRFTANYRGMLASGKQFDAGTLSNYRLTDLIPGFAGIVGMTKGETRLVVIPSELGYGGETVGEIPANSVLVFEVTLVQINP